MTTNDETTTSADNPPADPPPPVGADTPTDGGFTEFNNAAQGFNASLGEVMGGWMSALTKADVDRQVAWTRLLQELFTPDKDGNVPTVDMVSALNFSGSDDKTKSSKVGIGFPVGLAVMGEQFAGDTAELKMSMNVSASALDAGKVDAAASGSGEAKIGWGPISAKISISASMSTHSEHKRQSDYRSTTDAVLTMKRVPTPEPIQVALNAFTSLVEVQGEIAKAQIIEDAKNAAIELKVLNGNNPPS